MDTRATPLSIPPDSDLARALREAREYLDVDTGDARYRLHVERRVASPPIPEQLGRSLNGIRASAGAWKGLVDAEAFKAEIVKRRRSGSRPSISL